MRSALPVRPPAVTFASAKASAATREAPDTTAAFGGANERDPLAVPRGGGMVASVGPNAGRGEAFGGRMLAA